jgi:hypothetical protein
MLQVLEAGTAGNLILNQYHKVSGTWTLNGYMYLNGFGHGTSFGVFNSSGSTDWFFTEGGDDPLTGRGLGITWFKWVHNTTINGGISPNGYWPIGSDISCAVDPGQQYLAVRSRSILDGKFYYTVWGVGPFLTLGPLAPNLIDAGPFPEYSQDSRTGSGNAYAFQGFTIWGSYLYTISQQVSPPTASGSPDQQKWHCRSYDLNGTLNNSSGYIAVSSLHAGPTATPGEIEGITPWNFGGPEQLAFMITSNGGSPTHKWNLHLLS